MKVVYSYSSYSQQVIRFHLKCSTSHIFILQDFSGCWDGRPFDHNRHGQKSGRLLCPYPWGELDPYLTQCGVDRGLRLYQVGAWSIQPFGHSTWAENLGRLCLFGGAGSPSNTMWPGPRPTSAPNGILIHPAVWHNRYGPKMGDVPLLGEAGAGSPSNAMWCGPRLPPYQVAS